MSEVNQAQRAAVAWNVLKRVAKERTTITHGKLGRELGIHHRPVRFVLAIIQDHCIQEHLLPLTILVVDRDGVLGEGFIAWDIDNAEEGFEKVYGFNWDNLDNPFSYAMDGLTEDEVVRQMLSTPANTRELYTKIKSRGIAQPMFRGALLRAYNRKCAFCGLSIEIALQGAHIIPWSIANIDQRLNVQNGLLLCATHHKLFDERLLTINDDYTIVSNNTRKRKDSEYDILLTSALHNNKITLPVDKKHWPVVSYLQKHRQGFKKKKHNRTNI
jgi:putative restriction endonuclease